MDGLFHGSKPYEQIDKNFYPPLFLVQHPYHGVMFILHSHAAWHSDVIEPLKLLIMMSWCL